MVPNSRLAKWRAQPANTPFVEQAHLSASQDFTFSLAREVLARYFTGPQKALANSSPCAYNTQYEKRTDQLSLAPGFGSINTVL
jgi:hypothetical protein